LDEPDSGQASAGPSSTSQQSAALAVACGSSATYVCPTARIQASRLCRVYTCLSCVVCVCVSVSVLVSVSVCRCACVCGWCVFVCVDLRSSEHLQFGWSLEFLGRTRSGPGLCRPEHHLSAERRLGRRVRRPLAGDADCTAGLRPAHGNADHGRIGHRRITPAAAARPCRRADGNVATLPLFCGDIYLSLSLYIYIYIYI